GLLQTSVFPVPPGQSRTVQIRYSQLLRKDNGLVDLLLPIGTVKHARRPVQRLSATVRIETTQPLKTVYSPTHPIEIQRPDGRHAVCKLTLFNVRSPDDFRLLFGAHEGAVGMNLVSYRPKTGEEGYFLLLASPDIKPNKAADLPKTVVFVIDRSGSMSGKKIEQVRRALKFLLDQLKPQDTFNIVAYDAEVESFRPELQRADLETVNAARGFADGLYAGGSTNIDAALRTALGMLTDSSRPNYVLFLTDGRPTTGERNEMRIARNAKQANRVAARLFCFGVGFDVNSRLLDRLSRDNRGETIYVRPNEDIEAPIARLASRISSPVMTDLALKFDFDAARPTSAPPPVARIYPSELPDLFRGEQLIVVGRYRQAGRARITLSGMQAG
ncbi:MAG TPA: VWA domain-containing protein, partial [Planctomycetaceae bacterium]|nr:VWA domain-containing protein [Planctomycetaceae bacterium]